MNIKISKTISECYKVENLDSRVFADIYLEFGDSSVKITINADYGTFSYFWGSTGKNPKEFLKRIDFYYTMEKFVGSSLYEPDFEKRLEAIKKTLFEKRKSNEISKKVAKNIYDEINFIFENYNSEDIIVEKILQIKNFNKIYEDIVYMPFDRKVKNKFKYFWDEIWIPFVENLKEE